MNNQTIFLCLEDDPRDVELLRKALEEFDHHRIKLQVAEDGLEAIEYLTGQGEFTDRSLTPMPDVILCDLKMPRVDGFRFLQWLRNESPDALRRIPVIVMSALANERDVNRAYELGANFYMIKPIKSKTFRERLHLLGILWSEHAQTPTVQEQ